MRKVKKIVIPFLIFLMSFFVGSVAYAATLGVLSYWDTDSSQIARWGSTPTVYNYAVDGSLQGTLPTYVSYAISQWSNAGISCSSTSNSSANIKIYGGTYDNLKSMAPDLTTNDTGLTLSYSNYEGDWIALGIYRSGKKLTSASTYIVYESGKSGVGYKNTVTHELGHALGWYGHSSGSSDIMYPYATNYIILSTVDKRHLKQVY